MSKQLFEKKCVSEEEYIIYKYVFDLNIVNIPKLINYDKDKKIMTTEKIMSLDLSNNYGEELEDLNDNQKEYIYDNIREIIITLYKNNIIYPDITGYNFIEDKDGKIWIIDFEHAIKFNNNEEHDEDYNVEFVKKFMGGLNSWNPDFR